MMKNMDPKAMASMSKMMGKEIDPKQMEQAQAMMKDIISVTENDGATNLSKFGPAPMGPLERYFQGRLRKED